MNTTFLPTVSNSTGSRHIYILGRLIFFVENLGEGIIVHTPSTEYISNKAAFTVAPEVVANFVILNRIFIFFTAHLDFTILLKVPYT